MMWNAAGTSDYQWLKDDEENILSWIQWIPSKLQASVASTNEDQSCVFLRDYRAAGRYESSAEGLLSYQVCQVVPCADFSCCLLSVLLETRKKEPRNIVMGNVASSAPAVMEWLPWQPLHTHSWLPILLFAAAFKFFNYLTQEGLNIFLNCSTPWCICLCPFCTVLIIIHDDMMWGFSSIIPLIK